MVEVGLGLTCFLRDAYQLVFDVDGRFSESYSGYAVSGRMVFEF